MNYPPGVTQWHIDYYAGGYDEPREEDDEMPDDTVTLTLTQKQAEFLSECLHSYTDCGPRGEGWASGALTELRELVAALIQS